MLKEDGGRNRGPGGKRVEIAMPKIQELNRKRSQLPVTRLEQFEQDDTITLYYQPKINIHDPY